MTVGPLFAAGALFWLSRLTAGSGYIDVVFPMVVLALGMGMSFVPLTLTAVAGVRQHETGLASALLNTGQQIGGALGLGVLGTIAASTIKSQVRQLAASSPGHLTHHLMNVATTTGYAHAFLVAAFIALGAFLVAVVAVRVKAPRRPGMAAPHQPLAQTTVAGLVLAWLADYVDRADGSAPRFLGAVAALAPSGVQGDTHARARFAAREILRPAAHRALVATPAPDGGAGVEPPRASHDL